MTTRIYFSLRAQPTERREETLMNENITNQRVGGGLSDPSLLSWRLMKLFCNGKSDLGDLTGFIWTC